MFKHDQLFDGQKAYTTHASELVPQEVA
jgi:hypothetical protein